MFRILIVDDERRERDGIERLIHKYQYPLEVVQAQNGEEALDLFKEMEVDILLTDIKMPFMTGIELIEKVRKRGYTPFCIIYSAYGEFEYAQNAIALGVIQYLLKPILLDDFKSLFDKVIRLCEEKQQRREKQKNEIKETSDRKTTESFKTFLLYLENAQSTEEEVEALEDFFSQTKYRMVMLSGYSSLFFVHWKEFENDLREIIGQESLIININDMQSLLLVPADGEESDKYIKHCCERIIKLSQENYQFDIFMVVSPVCDNLAMMKTEYKKIHENLDYQFFVTESAYILYDIEYVSKKQSDMLLVYFNKIQTYTKLKDYEGIKVAFQNVFEYIDQNIGFSSIYIKYSFTDILKKMCDILKCENSLIGVVEKIYETKTLEAMKSEIIRFVDLLEENDNDSGTDKRLVVLAKKWLAKDIRMFHLEYLPLRKSYMFHWRI